MLTIGHKMTALLILGLLAWACESETNPNTRSQRAKANSKTSTSSDGAATDQADADGSYQSEAGASDVSSGDATKSSGKDKPKAGGIDPAKDLNDINNPDASFESGEAVPQEKVDIFNEACAQALQLDTFADVTYELGLLCKDGQATPKFKTVAANAFNGSGSPKYATEKLASNNRETEVVVITANVYQKTIAQMRAKRETAESFDATTGNVTITRDVIGKANRGDGLIVKTRTQARVLFINIDDEMITESQTTELDGIDANFSYSALAPNRSENAENSANNKSAIFMMEIEPGKSITVAVQRQVVANQGFGSIAEQQVPGQIEANIKALYNAVAAP